MFFEGSVPGVFCSGKLCDAIKGSHAGGGNGRRQRRWAREPATDSRGQGKGLKYATYAVYLMLPL